MFRNYMHIGSHTVFIHTQIDMQYSGHRTLAVRVFSAFRHFLKTNVTQSVAELIQNSQKT